MLNPKQEAEIFRRLDAQAEAIRVLRKEVAALRDGIGDRTIPATVEQPGTTGTYVYNPCCVLCGATKPVGRKELTCRECGSARNNAIRGNGQRRTLPTCCNCGRAKSGGTTLLCAPCRVSYKEWKEGKQ